MKSQPENRVKHQHMRSDIYNTSTISANQLDIYISEFASMKHPTRHLLGFQALAAEHKTALFLFGGVLGFVSRQIHTWGNACWKGTKNTAWQKCDYCWQDVSRPLHPRIPFSHRSESGSGFQPWLPARASRDVHHPSPVIANSMISITRWRFHALNTEGWRSFALLVRKCVTEAKCEGQAKFKSTCHLCSVHHVFSSVLL